MTLLHKFILIPFVFLAFDAFAQDKENYLHDNAISLTYKSLDQSKVVSDFKKYQLFLIGEIHGIKRGQEVDFTLLTYLNRELNVCTYVAEFDFAKAALLNEYLQTGRENLIDSVFADWKIGEAQWANQNFQDKIRKIRTYNLTLKPRQRIHFEGIDQIQNPELVAGYLKKQLKDKQYVPIRNLFTPLIQALASKNDSLTIRTATALLDTLKRGCTALNKEKNADLFFAVKNCTMMKSSREARLYDNFKELYQQKGWANEKLYGFFGFFHILQSKVNEGKGLSLAYRLTSDPDLALKGKILSVGMLYLDSKMTMPSSALPAALQDKGKKYTAFGQYNHDGPMVKMDGIEDFKRVTKPGSITLFNLIGPGSPYLKSPLDIHYAEMVPQSQRLLMNEKGRAAADYFQYVVLVRNSEGTIPIGP